MMKRKKRKKRRVVEHAIYGQLLSSPGILLRLTIPTDRGRIFFEDIVRSESLTDRLKTVFILR